MRDYRHFFPCYIWGLLIHLLFLHLKYRQIDGQLDNDYRIMKISRFLSILCITAVLLPAYAITPKTETSNRWMRITDVERTDSALRVGVRLRHLPHYWVMLSSSNRLIATEDTTCQYKLIGTENIELDKRIWMPESGKHDGVLLFEKVPADVKVVDMVESDPTDVGNSTYGIWLDQPETRMQPDLITFADIMDNGGKQAEPWDGPATKRYADMNFYDRDGMVHIRGRITDYSPRYGVTTFSVRTKDDFSDNDKMNVGNISPDGTFETEFPLTYPQFDYFRLGNISKNIFLIPGDTIYITTCMASKVDPESGYVPEYFGFEGVSDDAVAINMLTDSLYNRYGINSLFHKYTVAENDSMKAETYKVSERLAALLDSVCADLPRILADVPVSAFAKDMVSMAVIGQICGRMEDIQMDFRHAKGARYEKDEGQMFFKEGETLDNVMLLSPWMKHKDLIYNNPLLVCSGWILPNRWRFNSLFHPTSMTAEGMVKVPGTLAYMSTDSLSGIWTEDLARLDSTGLGNCFVAQMVRTVSFIDNLHTTDDPSSATLAKNNRLISNIIRHNEYDVLNEILLSEYNSFVKDVVIAENQTGDNDEAFRVIPDSPEGNVLSRIIEPYKGNVLFLDFWGIGCGPCRSGMLRQKPLLESMADKPFRALYIANADEGLEACRKWLRKEEIKGEHIFVSGDDWQRLTGLLNFSAIPFGVLIDKEGNFIKIGYHIQEDDPLLKKALQD